MAGIGGVVINFAARTTDAIRDVDKLTRSLRDTGKESDTTGRKASGLSSTLKTGLKAGALAAAAGVATLAVAAVEWGKAALADEQSAGKLADTLSKIPGITQANIDANEDWISSMQLSTLVADTDLRTAISKLALATGDLGQAQKLAALSADVAAGSGKNYTTVTDAMAKAAAGNTAQLTRMFPWLDKNSDGTVTFAEATAGLGKAFKGAAASAANRAPFERMKVIWDELKESLGKWLLPLVEEFGNWFKDKKNQRAIQDMIDSVGDLAQGFGEDLVPALRDFLKWVGSEEGKKSMREYANSLATIAGAISSLVGWISTLISWWNRLPGPLKGLAGLGQSLGRSSLPTVSTFSSTAPTAFGTPRPRRGGTPAASFGSLTLNFYGWNGTPEDNARALKATLEGHDIRQGRKPGAPRPRAW